MEKGLGALLSPKDVRDYKATCVAGATFPDRYEVYTPPIKDQGSVGSCVAHSLAEVIEMFNHHQETDNTLMSTGTIYGNREGSDHKGEGMIIRDAIKAVFNYGTAKHESFPYNIEVPQAITQFEEVKAELSSEAYQNKISSYYDISSDDAIKAALTKGDAVIFSIKWYRDAVLMADTNVLYTSKNKKYFSGYHCMVIYGWNEHGWLVQNSWGEEWGNQGKCVLPYDYERAETWGISDGHTRLDAKREWLEKNKAEVESLQKKIDEIGNTITQLQKIVDKMLNGEMNGDPTPHMNNIEKFKEIQIELGAEMEALKVQIEVIEAELKELEEKEDPEEDELLDIEEPYKFKFGEFIAKVINFILNLLSKFSKK